MRNHKKLIKFAMFFLVCIITVCAFHFVGPTNAYYTGSDSKENSIGVQKVEIKLDEKVSGLQKTEVSIQNPNKARCYVRIKVMVPKINGLTIESGPKYGEFVKGDDDFYYWHSILPSNGEVTLGGSDDKPFYKVRFDDSLLGEEEEKVKERERIASLADVVIYAEAVQADGIDLPDNINRNSAEAAMYAFSLLK